MYSRQTRACWADNIFKAKMRWISGLSLFVWVTNAVTPSLGCYPPLSIKFFRRLLWPFRQAEGTSVCLLCHEFMSHGKLCFLSYYNKNQTPEDPEKPNVIHSMSRDFEKTAALSDSFDTSLLIPWENIHFLSGMHLRPADFSPILMGCIG